MHTSLPTCEALNTERRSSFSFHSQDVLQYWERVVHQDQYKRTVTRTVKEGRADWTLLRRSSASPSSWTWLTLWCDIAAMRAMHAEVLTTHSGMKEAKCWVKSHLEDESLQGAAGRTAGPKATETSWKQHILRRTQKHRDDDRNEKQTWKNKPTLISPLKHRSSWHSVRTHPAVVWYVCNISGSEAVGGMFRANLN